MIRRVRWGPVTGEQIVCDEQHLILATLRRASSSVAVLRPTGQRAIVRAGGVPFTISRVSVVKRLSGAPLPATLGLRQTGAPGAGLQGCPALVSAGRTYVAYLSRFRLRRHGPGVPGQYIANGLFPRGS